MNTSDLLQGFRTCRQEIKTLRERNERLEIEVDAYNRILSALEAGRPSVMTNRGGSEDIMWKLEKTERFLAGKLDEEEEKKKEGKIPASGGNFED